MTHIIKFTTEDDKFLNRATEIKEFTIDGKPQIVSSSSVDLFESSVSLTYYEAVYDTHPMFNTRKGLFNWDDEQYKNKELKFSYTNHIETEYAVFVHVDEKEGWVTYLYVNDKDGEWSREFNVELIPFNQYVLKYIPHPIDKTLSKILLVKVI